FRCLPAGAHHALGSVRHAHVSEITNGHLRHGRKGVFGNHAVRAVQRNSKPATHDHAVNDGYYRLGALSELAVDGIFTAKEIIHEIRIAVEDIVAGVAYVTTGAKGLRVGGVNHDLIDRVIIFPRPDGFADDFNHLWVQGV